MAARRQRELGVVDRHRREARAWLLRSQHARGGGCARVLLHRESEEEWSESESEGEGGEDKLKLTFCMLLLFLCNNACICDHAYCYKGGGKRFVDHRTYLLLYIACLEGDCLQVMEESFGI